MNHEYFNQLDKTQNMNVFTTTFLEIFKELIREIHGIIVTVFKHPILWSSITIKFPIIVILGICLSKISKKYFLISLLLLIIALCSDE